MPTNCWPHNRMVEKNRGELQKRKPVEAGSQSAASWGNLACYALLDGGCRRLTLGGVAAGDQVAMPGANCTTTITAAGCKTRILGKHPSGEVCK